MPASGSMFVDIPLQIIHGLANPGWIPKPLAVRETALKICESHLRIFRRVVTENGLPQCSGVGLSENLLVATLQLATICGRIPQSVFDVP